MTGPDAVVNVPLEGVEAKLTILNTPEQDGETKKRASNSRAQEKES